MGRANTFLGMIGLGAIGTPIAERLLLAGHRLAVYDVRADALAPFTGRAEIAASAAALADISETIIGCLSTLASYRDAVAGPNGLHRGGAMKRYIHIGTTGGDLVRELAEVLAKNGVETLDAPVTGGVPRAKSGELTVIAAGRTEAMTNAEPIFHSYGNRIVHVGEHIGSAQTVKLINNMLSAANLAIACEAMTFGARAGIAADKLLEVINSGTGQSNASLTKVPRHVLTRTFDYGGSLQVTLKDTAQYQKEAIGLGAPCEIAAAVTRAYFAASESGLEDADMTAIALHFERLAEGAQAADAPVGS